MAKFKDAKQEADRLRSITQEQWDLAHLQLEETPENLKNPFLDDVSEYDMLHPTEHLLSVMMNPDYFGWTCSKIFNTAISPNGLELLPMQCSILKEMWWRSFPILIGSRGLGKSFLLGLYSILRALFIPGRKIVVTGAGFRQSKLVLAYAENIWYNSPVLRDMCGASKDRNQGPHHDADRYWMQIGESTIVGLPIGTGEKIRGQRAHDILTDEFSSISQSIFEEVIAGFGVVNLDPISQVKHHQRMKYLKDTKKITAEEASTSSNILMPNQMILTGTASFSFNHFYKYWKKHKAIILSQGNKKKMKQFGVDEKLDYRKYSVIRIPSSLLPIGFMDQAQIDRSQATMATGIFANEFGGVFTDDSTGFFRRSILDKAMPGFNSPVLTPDGNVVEMFSALLKGDPAKQYVMAIDPASQRDNFAIVILELHEDHARIVHVWTTNAEDHLALQAAGHIKEKDFYAYCARKIRDLMKLFNIIYISTDSQGGGRTISEALHNEKYLEHGEQLIWPIDKKSPIWDGQTHESDNEAGLHILEFVHFANAKYTSDANHGMKNDFEQKSLLFPYSDDIEYILAGKSDFDSDRKFDTLEQVIAEIDALKDELSMIVHDATTTGRERWGAPKVKGSSTMGDLHDDRYSALLMANYVVRRLRQNPETQIEYVTGGFVGSIQSSPLRHSAPEPLYTGPAWATKPLNALTGYGLVKRGD